MKRWQGFLLCICCLHLLIACREESRQATTRTEEDTTAVTTKPVSHSPIAAYRPDAHHGAEHKGNYIWSAAMDLAWKEFCANVTLGNPSYAGSDTNLAGIVDVYNASGFSSGDLDATSYLVKTGYGPGTLTAMRKELKERFPRGKLKIPDIPLRESDIILFAYFLKELEYEVPFDTATVEFEGKYVKGFRTKAARQWNNVEVMQYDSDDRFLLRLKLKQFGDQLFLAKGFAMESPDEVLKTIHGHQDSTAGSMRHEDQFHAPFLKLDFQRNILPKFGIKVENAGQFFQISKMEESIQFEMDEVGARVENLAQIGPLPTPTPPPGLQPRKLFLDKPYWVILRRTNSVRPYFILGVRNDKLMEPAE